MIREYDKTDAQDQAWRRTVYQTALAEIEAFLVIKGGSARFEDICLYIEARYPSICKDDLRSPTNFSFPQWKHTIASALQALKKKRAVEPDQGYWYLLGAGRDRDIRKREYVRPEPVSPTRDESKSQTIDDGSKYSSRVNLTEALLDRVRALAPSAFERLIAKVLSNLGYVQVQVTGGSHDGGIDGTFEAALVGLKMAYQAKKYDASNPVRAVAIRDFRGAMVSREQSGGLFITTSSFTDDAKMEARGAGPKIALIDGQQFAQVLLDNTIGIKSIVTEAEMDEDFFRDL